MKVSPRRQKKKKKIEKKKKRQGKGVSEKTAPWAISKHQRKRPPACSPHLIPLFPHSTPAGIFLVMHKRLLQPPDSSVSTHITCLPPAGTAHQCQPICRAWDWAGSLESRRAAAAWSFILCAGTAQLSSALLPLLLGRLLGSFPLPHLWFSFDKVAIFVFLFLFALEVTFSCPSLPPPVLCRGAGQMPPVFSPFPEHTPSQLPGPAALGCRVGSGRVDCTCQSIDNCNCSSLCFPQSQKEAPDSKSLPPHRGLLLPACKFGSYREFSSPWTLQAGPVKCSTAEGLSLLQLFVQTSTQHMLRQQWIIVTSQWAKLVWSNSVSGKLWWPAAQC